MKRFILLSLIFFCFTCAMRAQDYRVVSVEHLPNDMSARKEIKTDEKNRQCALLRIATKDITSQQRAFFFFECDWASWVVERRLVDGEIWVWVSPGLATLKIKHQELGSYELQMATTGVGNIESLHVYKIVIQGTMKPGMNSKVTQQYLVVNVTPKDAKVTVDGQPLPVRAGMATKLVDFGTHQYTVEAPDYHAESGEVEVDDPNDKVIHNVNLKKAYGFVKIEGDKELLSQASIYIDNGNGAGAVEEPQKVRSGEHLVQIAHPMYLPFEQSFTVADGETYTMFVNLEPDFANITLAVDADAEIWVDGEKKGVRSWTGPLLQGDHTVSCRMQGCHETREVRNVTSDMDGQTISLVVPSAFTGRLLVNTTPAMAQLYIDGKKMNETPVQLNEIAVGKHTLRVEKEGYVAQSQTFIIEADKTLSLDLELEEVSAAGDHKLSTNDPVPNQDLIEKQEDVTARRKDHPWFLTANVAYNPVTPSFGITGGTLKKVGWFVSAMSNFDFKAMFYQATADDAGLVGGERPDYVGSSCATRLSVMGGVTLKLAGPLYARLGAGYGMQVLSARTKSGDMVRWPDGSVEGVDVTGGLQLKLNHFTISLDAVSTNFKTVEMKLGLGGCW